MSESAWSGYPPIEERDAEIERLRGLVAEKDTQLSQIPCRYNRCIEYAEAKAEIDRLNDALVIARTTNANLLSYADEQRRLLQECWNAHVGASAGFSSDLWDRVRDAVMEGSND